MSLPFLLRKRQRRSASRRGRPVYLLRPPRLLLQPGQSPSHLGVNLQATHRSRRTGLALPGQLDLYWTRSLKRPKSPCSTILRPGGNTRRRPSCPGRLGPFQKRLLFDCLLGQIFPRRRLYLNARTLLAHEHLVLSLTRTNDHSPFTSSKTRLLLTPLLSPLVVLSRRENCQRAIPPA